MWGVFDAKRNRIGFSISDACAAFISGCCFAMASKGFLALAVESVSPAKRKSKGGLGSDTNTVPEPTEVGLWKGSWLRGASGVASQAAAVQGSAAAGARSCAKIIGQGASCRKRPAQHAQPIRWALTTFCSAYVTFVRKPFCAKLRSRIGCGASSPCSKSGHDSQILGRICQCLL